MKFSYSFSGVFLSASLLASVATAQVPFTISNLSGGSTVVAGSNTSVEVVRTPDQPGIKTHDLAIVLTVSICSSEKGCQESNKLGTAEYIGPYDVNEHHGNGKGPGRQGLAAAKPAGGGGNGHTNTYVVTIPKADPAGKKVEKVMLNVIGVGLRGNSTKLSTFVESIHLPLTVVDEANGNGTSTGTATDGGPTGTGTATDGGPTGTGTATDGGPTGTGTATDGGPTGTGTATDGGPTGTGTGTATDGGPTGTGTGTGTDGGPTGTGTATATDTGAPTGTNTGSSSSSSTTKAGATSKPTAVNGKNPAPTITVFPKGCKCSTKVTREEVGVKRAVDPAAPAYTTIRMSSRTRRRALS